MGSASRARHAAGRDRDIGRAYHARAAWGDGTDIGNSRIHGGATPRMRGMQSSDRAARLRPGEAMTRDLAMWALTALTLTFASSAHTGTITPDLVPVPVSPAFGDVAAGGRVTDQFKAFGVIFSDGVATAIFDDPPLAFGGVNLAGTLDLVTPVNGFEAGVACSCSST